MGIIKNKLKQEIDNNNKLQFSNTTGVILSYDNTSNTATIEFRNPNGEGTFRRENVPITNSLGGLCGSGIKIGQICSISFRANNVYAPVITGIMTNYYQEKTNTDQGACLVNNYIYQTERPDNIKPMYKTWVDENNNNIGKYINPYSEYAGTDSATEVYNMLRNIDKYTDKEQGITNLDTKSTIKLRENGDIDIFVANNIGLRISKRDGSINLYGKVQINGQDIDLNELLKLLNDTSVKE